MRAFDRTLAPLIAVLLLSGCAAWEAASAPPSLYADYLNGRYADLRRDTGVAASRYMAALRRAPNDAVLLDGAVDSALASGDTVRAEEAARLSLRSGAQSDLGRLTLAAIALRGGDYRGAENRLNQGDIGSFDRLAAVMIRAWALAGRGQSDQAAAALADGAGGPFRALFDYQRALLFDYAGRTEDALASYHTAEQSNTRVALAVVRHGRLLERLGRGQEAAAIYRTALARGEDPSLAAEMKRLSAGQPVPADPLTPGAGAAIGLYSIAAAIQGQSDPDLYLPLLTLTEVLDPDLDAAWLIYGEGMRQVKQYPAARAALSKVAAASPWYETAQTRIAWVYREEDNDAQALAVARAVGGANAGRSARITLADMERANDNWAVADTLYSALIAESVPPKKNDWPLYFARGSVRDQLGRWPEGEADLKQALALSPDQPEVLNYLGYSWVDKGVNLDEAFVMLRKAVSLDPDAGYIIDSLGWAQFKLGDYDAAVESLERAVELEPNDSTLNDHLGDAYWRTNRRVEARFQWARALTMKPPEKDKALIEAKVKQGLPDLPPPRRTAGGGSSAKPN